MLKPAVRIKVHNGYLMADFWDCVRLDPAPIKELRTAYDAHVRGGGHGVIVVDLTGVSFAGSTALGGFVALSKHGARLIFHNVEPTVREVFRVSNLATLFGFAENEDAAMEAANSVIAGGGSGGAGSSSQVKGSGAGSPEGNRANEGPLPTAPPPLRRSRRGQD
jgi:anti-anti-sigma factor